MNINYDSECKKILKDIDFISGEIRTVKTQLSKVESTSSLPDCVTLEDGSLVSSDESLLFDDTDSYVFDDSKYNPYLQNYINLPVRFTYEDLLSILPSKDNKIYGLIIKRLIAESLKNIKEFKKLAISGVLESSDLNDCFSTIRSEQRKIDFLKQLLVEKEEVSSDEININKLILVPTPGGNTRVIEDLSDIPMEYYPEFSILINSIINGTFKGKKQFREYKGYFEVRLNQCRVLYSQISDNTYAVITAFVKKTDSNSIYQSWLDNCYSMFISFLDKYDSNDVDFIIQNDEQLSLLDELLSKKNKTLIKGDDKND